MLSFSFGYSPWLLALSVVLAAGLTYWTYRRTLPALSPGWRWGLGTLRFVALTLLCFLLLEPVARQVERIEQPPLLALLVDNSESLRVTMGAPGDTSATRPRDAIRSALQSLSTDAAAPRVFAFDNMARAVAMETPAAASDSLSFDGARTDLTTALQSMRDALSSENLQGVVLLSDGQYNTGRNPLYVADRFPVPIHTVTLGDTTRQRDLQIRRVTTNDVAYANSELPVQVGLRVNDAGGERVTVSLLRNGERVDATEVRLPEGTAEVPVDLTATPTEPGLYRFTVSVTPLADEATERNNRQSVAVRVLERKRRVLLVGGAPSPNVAAIRRIIERDADTDVVARITRKGGGFYGGALPDDLTDVDVMVLAGFPASVTPPSTLARVAEAASEVPTLFFLDRQTDLQSVRSALADALPVTLERPRPGFSEAVFTPSDAQAQHPVLQIEGGNLAAFEQLPPLQANDSRWRATPDAEVLATATVRGVALDDPLLVVRRRSGVRSAAMLATDTWRWANLPAGLEAARPLWPGVVANLVRWAATRDADQPVRVRPVTPSFGGNEPIEFTGQVYDESMQAVPDAAVDVTVTAPDGSQYPYAMDPVGNGRYVLDVGTLPEGAYEYRATATRQGSTLGTDRGQFSVGALTLEYRETRANPTLMRQIAQRSGGTAHTASSVDALMERLNASGAFEPTVLEETREAELWHASLFLAVILLCLGAEWTLRKRMGLA